MAIINGTAANDALAGTAGNDIIDGLEGADTMAGGKGNDTYYVDNIGDVVVESGISKSGTDTVISTVSYTLSVNVENLVLAGAEAINGTGNSGNNSIISNAADNIIDGGLGSDWVGYNTAAAGVIVDLNLTTAQNTVGGGTDTLLNIENLAGSNYDDTLIGNALNNILSGGAGADTLMGGLGDDVYYADAADTIIENAGEGSDTILSSLANYTLSIANVENLTLTGTAAINGTGDEFNNVLTGNSGINILTGGLGNDTYVVQNTGDIVVENAGEGVDTVSSSVSYTLSENVENLNMTGGGNGTGNALNNVMNGSASIQGNVLAGGLGNDSYYLSMDGYYGYDTVVENANEGIDTLFAYGWGTLGGNVENLTVLGGYRGSFNGNELDNIIDSRAGYNNVLVGKGGNDTYYVAEGSVVVESANEGVDTVVLDGNNFVSYDCALSANVENLIVTTGVGQAAPFNNRLTGNDLNNTLTANNQNNTLNGLAGADTMIGGLGDDTYIVDDTADAAIEAANEGIDNVQSSALDYTLNNHVENLTLTGAAAINGTGNNLDNLMVGNNAINTLNGEDGNDTLDGKGGVDTLIGDHGNDIYIVDNTADVVVENAGEGIDTVQSYATDYTLSANVENLTLIIDSDGFTYSTPGLNGTGNDLDNILTGNALYNTLRGGSGNDTLDGGDGQDSLYGGLGDDIYYVEMADYRSSTRWYSGDREYENAEEGTDTVILLDSTGLRQNYGYTLRANIENLILTGAGDKYATGNELNNVLTGNAGNNTLNGLAGADTMIGGIGNDDYYVDDLGDAVIENAQEGMDSVQSSLSYTLGENVENLVLVGAAAINGTGNDVNNILNGSYGNTLSGYNQGGAGGIVAANVLTGGLGNDTYYVDAADMVIENEGEGIDTVVTDSYAFSTYTLAAAIENLSMGRAAYGGGGRTAIGNNLNNSIWLSEPNLTTSHGYADIIDGGAGADYMSGGDGNDTYYVDNIGDRVGEAAGSHTGVDTAISSVSYTLSANVENLTLTGLENLNATGNESNNQLIGNAGVNILTGGLGDDHYVMDNTVDVIVENAGEGVDTVQSSVSYSLVGSNLENVTLTGSDNVNATGNEFDNVLYGNEGNNVLEGGAGNDTFRFQDNGNDTLIGGTGNDYYYLNERGASPWNAVIESQGEGFDTVWANASSLGPGHVTSYTLSDNVENLVMDTYLMNGFVNRGELIGNDLNNSLSINGIGSQSADILDGGAGADTMSGMRGSDTYYVDNIGDVVIEYSSIGIYTQMGNDTVISSISDTLDANVENMILSGTDNLNATGNDLDNVLTGNAGDNILAGGLGNDTLKGDAGNDVLEGADGNDTLSDTAGNNLFNGGAGTDTLTGNTGKELFIGGLGNDTITTGTGADILAFNKGDGVDTVVASTGADNTLSLGGGINYAGLTLSKSGANLILDTGGTDQIILQNWYTGTTNHSVANLQLELDATTYNAASADVLLNQQIQNFDFALLAQNFDAALAATPTLSAWSLSNALLTAHLSGSNTAALGGDLAYQYNLNGTLAGIGLAAAQTELSNAGFGTTAQTLQPLATLQTGTDRLG